MPGLLYRAHQRHALDSPALQDMLLHFPYRNRSRLRREGVPYSKMLQAQSAGSGVGTLPFGSKPPKVALYWSMAAPKFSLKPNQFGGRQRPKAALEAMQKYRRLELRTIRLIAYLNFIA